MRIYVFGAGKAGRALGRALRRGGAKVTVRARRKGLPRRLPSADLLILAVRDGQLAPLAEDLAMRGSLPWAAVVHCAGALPPDVLEPLRSPGTAIGQLHPLVALASGRSEVTGAYAHVDGDPAARALARRAAQLAGMRPFTAEGLDHTLYHACAALLANGGAALAASAARGLAEAGCDPALTPAMLGRLLESVGRNLCELGLPDALTGPVRRGHADAIRAHLATLSSRAPDLVPLYRALAEAQLPLARALGEATVEDFDDIARALRKRS